jgi:NADH-quinone oxidoreductase subunit M
VSPSLLALLLVPLLGAVLVSLMPRRESAVAKGLALAVATVELGLAYTILGAVDPDVGAPQLGEVFSWIEPLGLHLRVAVDGLSEWPVALTVLAVPLALFGGWDHVREQGRDLGVPLLVFESAALAVLLAQDVGLMFAGWVLAAFSAWAVLAPGAAPATRRWVDRWLIGMQLGVGLWGAVAMSSAVAYYNVTPGEWSLRLTDLSEIMLPVPEQRLGFAAVAVAVAFAVAAFPLHAWLPAFAHSRNPVASAVVAVVSIELGVHLLERVGIGLFPVGAADLGPIVAGLALVGIAHVAFALRAERSLGRIAGYVMAALAGGEVIGVLTVHPDGTLGAAVLGMARGLGSLGFVLVVAAIVRSTGSDLVERGTSSSIESPRRGSAGRALVGVALAPVLAAAAGLSAIVAGAHDDAAVGLPDAGAVALLAAIGLVFVFVLGLVRVASGAREAETAELAVGGLLVRREAITLTLIVALLLGLGVRPVEVFIRGTWTARERAGQTRHRLCVGEAARALVRAERYDGLAVDCEESP